MKKFTFTLQLIGLGSNVQSAWRDAVEATALDNDPPPINFKVEDLEEDDDDE